MRLYAYAVDLGTFDAFLNMSIVDLLRRYQRDGRDSEERLFFTGIGDCDTYSVNPGGPIYATVGDDPERTQKVVTEEFIRTDGILQSTAREHISKESIYQAKSLLSGFSNCKGIDFIQRLTEGHYRRWIGSVLQSAKTILNYTEHRELENLFRRILRGVDCGYPIQSGDIGVVLDGLPFVPDDDPDLRFGRWSKDESAAAFALLSKVMKSSPTFTPVRGPISITPDEWHEWVRYNVTPFLKIGELQYKECNVLTFLG